MASTSGYWGRTALYRLFDVNAGLLYVGISRQPEVRWDQHAAKKAWWHEVAGRTVEWFDRRLEAAGAEVAAIQAEAPRYNKVFHPAYSARAEIPANGLSLTAFGTRAVSVVNEVMRTGEVRWLYCQGKRVAALVPTDLVPADMDADEIGIADARSNLTELVAHVRLLQKVKFLTNRARRVAVLVPIEYYERAERALKLVAEHPELTSTTDRPPKN